MKTILSKFQQIFHSPKMVAILNFQIVFKNGCISKTMLDRGDENFDPQGNSAE